MNTQKNLGRTSVLSLFLAIAAVVTFPAVVPARPPALMYADNEAASARPRSANASAFAPDKGTFRILVNGQQVGKEDFEVASDGSNWTVHGNTEIGSGKTATHITGALTLGPDGTPIHYEWSTEGSKKASAKVDFAGSTATIELSVAPPGVDPAKAHPFTQQFTFPSAQIAVLDNNLYDQFAILADLYDWNKKGAQTFPVLVPQELIPGSATVESMGRQEFNGKKFDELRVTTQDNEIDLYLDHSRLMAISVPSANAEILR
ncbi:MAG TPA: hypothetical protein VMF66_13740 [Candidatus Acidoferrum sp.]|nr:hypothetical protein [Candidatus Acidoferrum sp.]